MLLSPYLPLLFMGEEYGETAPFLYFVSHSDPGLVEAVRAGRKEEFAAFAWQGSRPTRRPKRPSCGPSSTGTARPNRPTGALFAFYRELIRLRKALPALRMLSKEHMETTAFEEERVLCLRRWSAGTR